MHSETVTNDHTTVLSKFGSLSEVSLSGLTGLISWHGPAAVVGLETDDDSTANRNEQLQWGGTIFEARAVKGRLPESGAVPHLPCRRLALEKDVMSFAPGDRQGIGSAWLTFRRLHRCQRTSECSTAWQSRCRAANL